MENIIELLAGTSFLIALYQGIKEIYYLYHDYHSGRKRKCINGNPLHNLQHIALIGMFAGFNILLLINTGFGIEVFIFNSLLIFFTLPHLIRERIDNL